MSRKQRKDCRGFLTLDTRQGGAGRPRPSRLPGRLRIRSSQRCPNTAGSVRRGVILLDESTPTRGLDHLEKRPARRAVAVLPPVAPTVALPQSPASPTGEAARPVPRFQANVDQL